MSDTEDTGKVTYETEPTEVKDEESAPIQEKPNDDINEEAALETTTQETAGENPVVENDVAQQDAEQQAAEPAPDGEAEVATDGAATEEATTDAAGVEGAATEEATTDAAAAEGAATEEATTEAAAAEGAATEEATTDAAAAEGAATEEAVTDAAAAEGAPTEEAVTNAAAAEGAATEEATTDAAAAEGAATEDATVEGAAAEGAATEAVTEETTEETADPAVPEGAATEAVAEETTEETPEETAEETTTEEATTDAAAAEGAATEEATTDAAAADDAAPEATADAGAVADKEGVDAGAKKEDSTELIETKGDKSTTENVAEEPARAEKEDNMDEEEALPEKEVEIPPIEIQGERPPIVSPPLVKEIEDPIETSKELGTDSAAQTKADAPGDRDVGQDATATVKLLLMPSGQTVTKTLQLRVTFGDVLEILAKDLRMPSTVLELLFNGKVVQENFRLEDYGIEANGTVAFEVNSKDPHSYPIREFVPRDPVGGMADVITVRIQMGDTYRDIVVEIERTDHKKPFLGGYRHKRSGTLYHHASVQTNPKVRTLPSHVERNTRDTQTWEGRHNVQQTFNTTSTQMTKPGIYMTNATDKLVIPGPYEEAAAYKARILAKVIVLQRYLRGWLAKRYVDKLREDKSKREDYEKEEELRKKEEKEERVRKDFQRRMNPKSKEDFDLLYSALEKWRQEELARINATMHGAERKAALYLLLEQETELIAAIDRHQLDANADNKEKGIQRLLSKAAASKKWRNKEGKLLEVDTPYTLRGKELLDIYNSLSMKYLTQDERLDVLLTLKHTVKEHDCKLTQEVVELIDREADLLMRGVKENNLAGLRKRITTLFLQYCKTPLFNPEMARLLKVPQDPSVLRQDIHFCVSCGRYLQSTEFSLGIKSTGIGRCRRCLRQDNLARTREDQSAYKYLLQDLRRREETFHDNDRIAFLIEEDDVRYLVDNIWEGMSILSSWNDLADLELVRWNAAAEWSPWNTVLLTKDEAEAHRKLIDLEQAYGNMLVHRVKQKHVLAKNYFHKLKHMVEKMRVMEMELENMRQTTK